MKSGDKFVLRMVKGEKFGEKFSSFLEDKNIEFCEFHAIGAANKIEAAYYSADKQYQSKTFEGELEITGILGNAVIIGGKPVIHAHIMFSENFQSFGGHLIDLEVGPTLEIFLTPLEGNPGRKFDEETGLKLLDL